MSPSLGSPLHLAHTHLDWGRALLLAPDRPDDARAHLDQAMELAVPRALALVERKARAALAELDAR